MRNRTVLAAAALVGVVAGGAAAAGCGDGTRAPPLARECNPLGGESCLLPWPLAWDFRTASDQMLRADLTAIRAQALPAIGAAGAHLTFTADELPATADRKATDGCLAGTSPAPCDCATGACD